MFPRLRCLKPLPLGSTRLKVGAGRLPIANPWPKNPWRPVPMRCLPPTSAETGPRADRRALVEVEKSRVAIRTSLRPKSRKSIAHHFNVSNRNHLSDLSSEEEIERPADHHSELLSKSRKLRQVDCPPQPPRDESRKRHPAHPGHASPPPDAGQKPHRPEPERLQRTPNHCAFDVPRGCHAFPQTVLCGRRVPRAPRGIRYCSAITSRPQATDTGNSQVFVHANTAPLLLARQ